MKTKETIRISCACLSSIKIDDKYLLVQNAKSRSRGKIIYGPVGGALEYKEIIETFLEGLEFKPERETRDLRIHIPTKFTGTFDKWFNRREDRETTSYREMYEELVLEEKVLPELSKKDVIETFLECVSLKKKSPFHKTPSQYYFEIYKIELPKDIKKELKRICEDPKSSVELFTEEEIKSKMNGKITEHSKHIIQ
ncbi:MAG: putative pyrophosphohydrolase [uncultured marine phage]|uniref:Putative pyrophosphohydrolase n=1 Tax=uncultured marine phage TaxID=707152 RepID=A0A8D9C8B9_9VIRU|nr:MAG: putative pyrophosphohydrolase [uncultured marine phage]